MPRRGDYALLGEIRNPLHRPVPRPCLFMYLPKCAGSASCDKIATTRIVESELRPPRRPLDERLVISTLLFSRYVEYIFYFFSFCGLHICFLLIFLQTFK